MMGMFGPLFFLLVVKSKDQEVCYSPGVVPLLAMSDILAASEMIH